MGALAAIEIDAWLREGGLVVTASDRAARSLVAAFHRARQTEGLTAWPAPNIQDWRCFARAAWLAQTAREADAPDARLLLSPAQEQALWVNIAGADHSLATLLEGPRFRVAALAMEAHELLCTHAPRFLRPQARAGWHQDAAAFSAWLTAFDETCRAGNLLSPSRLPLELAPLLSADQRERPPLLLAGFDRILPVQRDLFNAWGAWREVSQGEPATAVRFYAVADAQTELAACALWCGRRLAANPNARLLVIAQAASARRGEIERAFLEHTGPAVAPLFEFSLGIPLSQVALARAAHLLLRWLSTSLQEQELDWLLSTGHIAGDASENAALEAFMRVLRRRGLERTQWSLAAFVSQRSASNPLPAPWVERMIEAQRHMAELAHRAQSPLDWAEMVPRLLEGLHFAAARPLSSAEYQAVNRWQQAVETSGSLGFDGRRIRWREFLSQLGRTLDETLFAPESHDAPILIAGPAESAGLTADAVWFLGADEDAWPAGGSTHPLLPIEVQREAAMPHAVPQFDWELAGAITYRLLASAPEVHFSFAEQSAAAEARPSRLIIQIAGSPQPLPPELAAPPAVVPLTVSFEDFSRIPFSPGKVAGGSSVLTAQSQCPFRAFATARLAAQHWDHAEAGLTASQRGNLLHAVLHAVWAGPPDGIRTLADLQKLNDRPGFVAGHVQRALQQELRPHLRERMPRRYLELEEQRLTRLVSEWLEYEATRVDFEVAATEVKRTVPVAGLTLDLRLDRIDRLKDGSELVIDYKTGNVSPSCWDLPRPEDVQLPLYAGFALDAEEMLGGLVFAKVRTGGLAFAGRVGDAAATLFPGLKGGSPLVRNPLSAEQLLDWRDCIEQLARDFIAGHAEVDPREYPKTCEYCGLQALCRIQEHQAQLETEDDSDSAEAADE
ncbi:MAG: PD-(D/E)XK nuclease family protein [Terracidiphilus sp.]|jgi:probable DNA repair protein